MRRRLSAALLALISASTMSIAVAPMEVINDVNSEELFQASAKPSSSVSCSTSSGTDSMVTSTALSMPRMTSGGAAPGRWLRIPMQTR
eukprot:2729732-Prymnesium_polylepis.1